jgi:predicted alpha/beta superfamily hydrolase
MKKGLHVLVFFLMSVFSMAQSNVRIALTSLPVSHPSNSNIYIAGSFNNWNPQNEQFKFQQDEKGNYFINLKLNPGSYEYKITRGGWDKVECTKNGAGVANRILKVEADAAVEINIEGWQDQFNAKPKLSTASKNVRIVDTAFWIPQLKQTRRVWIYLPVGKPLHETRFPVLYMHDGQNVFEDTTSFSGEWGVDEFLDSSNLKQCIVVAIDNGANKRMNEYNPYDNERFGKGEGNDYIDFIVKTLKPFIDKHYQTQKRKTYIAGSSMGGLISMYALMKYPKVFTGAGVFSPSFWAAPKIFEALKKKSKKIKANIFFFAGKQEGDQMVSDMLKAFQSLAARKSKAKIKIVIRDEGRHNETTWRKEFPLGFEWILYGQ